MSRIPLGWAQMTIDTANIVWKTPYRMAHSQEAPSIPLLVEQSQSLIHCVLQQPLFALRVVVALLLLSKNRTTGRRRC